MLFDFVPGGGAPSQVDPLPRAASGTRLRMPKHIFRPCKGRDSFVNTKFGGKIVFLGNNNNLPSFFLSSCSNTLPFQAQERTILRERRVVRDVSLLEASFLPDRGTWNSLGVSPAEEDDGIIICTSFVGDNARACTRSACTSFVGEDARALTCSACRPFVVAG